MTKICTNCGNEFDAKRESARFCSDKCRTAHLRNVTTGEVSVTKVPNAHGENKRVSVTNSENEQKSKSSRNVTPLSVTNKEVSVTNVTDKASVTDSTTKDVTLKEDGETRAWLIQQFEAEGKPPDEIRDIMIAQDSYYQTRSYYFIPVRMLSGEAKQAYRQA